MHRTILPPFRSLILTRAPVQSCADSTSGNGIAPGLETNRLAPLEFFNVFSRLARIVSGVRYRRARL
jgi:hypothetical protein